jgi:hydrogenase maturation factor HypE
MANKSCQYHEAMIEMYEEGYGSRGIGEYFKRNKGTVVMGSTMIIIERLYLACC